MACHGLQPWYETGREERARRGSSPHSRHLPKRIHARLSQTISQANERSYTPGRGVGSISGRRFGAYVVGLSAVESRGATLAFNRSNSLASLLARPASYWPNWKGGVLAQKRRVRVHSHRQTVLRPVKTGALRMSLSPLPKFLERVGRRPAARPVSYLR